ncbi:MAG: LysM peptidoglycan-binding domain-containing protein [Chromatiaceae bacterium]|jgi:nucleoid-associated protein YgaU|nr:LysM peptidoglycan-binding domain-containing protein [Chromatiaceae bacterium]
MQPEQLSLVRTPDQAVRRLPIALLIAALVAAPLVVRAEGADESEAASVEAVAALEQQLSQARAEAADLAQRVEAAEAAKTQLAGDLAAAQEAQARLQADLSTAESALARLEADLAAANEANRIAQSGSAELERRLNEAQTAQEVAAKRQAAMEQELSGLRTQITAAEATRDEAQASLGALRARLTTAEGGTLTAEQAKADAATAAEALAAALRQGSGSKRTQAVGAAEDRLHQAQVLVARATGAGGVYRIRPQDSLAAVAKRFYGDGKLWTRLNQANRHVIDNPDRLIPGLTLVIP